MGALIIALAVVILLILVVGIWYAFATPTSDSAPTASETSPLPPPAVAVQEGPPVVTTQSSTPIVVPAPAPNAVSIQTPSGTTYTFYQGLDSGGNDIGNSGLNDNIPALKAWCTEREACKGFNTNAWMKHTILPREQWYRWIADTPENANKGMFVKN